MHIAVTITLMIHTRPQNIHKLSARSPVIAILVIPVLAIALLVVSIPGIAQLVITITVVPVLVIAVPAVCGSAAQYDTQPHALCVMKASMLHTMCHTLHVFAHLY
jgi:hypothetical protein